MHIDDRNLLLGAFATLLAAYAASRRNRVRIVQPNEGAGDYAAQATTVAARTKRGRAKKVEA